MSLKKYVNELADKNIVLEELLSKALNRISVLEDRIQELESAIREHFVKTQKSKHFCEKVEANATLWSVLTEDKE